MKSHYFIESKNKVKMEIIKSKIEEKKYMRDLIFPSYRLISKYTHCEGSVKYAKKLIQLMKNSTTKVLFFNQSIKTPCIMRICKTRYKFFL